MPSHETPADPDRRVRLLLGLGWLAGLPLMSATAAPTGALPAPPAGAQPVDWDHFGEPSLSAARRANVAVSRALKADAVDTQLYRLPGDAVWESVLGHYQRSAGPAWTAQPGHERADTGSPARQQRFVSSEDSRQRFAIVWLPAAGEVRDGLLMVLRTR